MILRTLLILLVMLVGQPTIASLTVIPSKGKAVGVVKSNIPGRYFVASTKPFKQVAGVQTLTDSSGNVVCVWEGEPGTYGVVLDPFDKSLPFNSVEVTLGGSPTPDPIDPDDPDDPVIPDEVEEGYKGLTRLTYNAAITVDKAHKAKAQALAGAYATVAQRFTQSPPVYVTIEDGFADLRGLIATILSSENEFTAWMPVSTKIKNKLDTLWPFDRAEANKLLVAIRNGLEFVK